jgi:hypothetical protein
MFVELNDGHWEPEPPDVDEGMAPGTRPIPGDELAVAARIPQIITFDPDGRRPMHE